MVEALWAKEKGTAVPPEVAVKAFGFGTLSGPARVAIGSMRKYGLLDKISAGIRPSELALRILHPEDPKDRQNAIREAALEPDMFSELAETHSQASDDALRSQLITRRKFTQRGAEKFIESFRDAVILASLTESGYSNRTIEKESEAIPEQMTVTAGDTTVRPGPGTARVFSWPLARGVMAEVRLTGDEIKPDHLERLRQYLELAKLAVASDDDENQP